MGAGDQTWVFWKSSNCSSPLSHLQPLFLHVGLPGPYLYKVGSWSQVLSGCRMEVLYAKLAECMSPSPTAQRRGRVDVAFLPQPSSPSPPVCTVFLQPPAAAPHGDHDGAMLFHYGEYLHHDSHSQGLELHGGGDPWLRGFGMSTMLFNGYMPLDIPWAWYCVSHGLGAGQGEH